MFGEFPPSSLNALIGPDEVSAAMKRCYRPNEIDWAAKVIGVDVARYGDDESALAFRQGLQALPFKTYRNLNSTQGAGLVARAWEEFGAHACFVDDTGGFGSGWIDGSEAARLVADRRRLRREASRRQVFQQARGNGVRMRAMDQARRRPAGERQSPHRLDADDLHVSGRQAAAANRKGFSKLLDRMEDNDVLVVTKLDRLGRNAMDVRATVEALAKTGVRVHCLALGGVDLTSAAGKMTMGVLNAVAEFERDC